MNTEPSFNKRRLQNGERYTFYLTNGRTIRGTYDHYLDWDRVRNKGYQLSNFSISPGYGQPFGETQYGRMSSGLDMVNKVTQYNIGPGTEDVNKVINSFYGGRKSRKSRKSRKVKTKTRQLKYKKRK